MRVLYSLLVASCLAAAGAGAQLPAKADSATHELSAFLRTRGDTLWVTPIEASRPGRPRGPQTLTLLVRDTAVWMVASDRRAALPRPMARIFRDFYQQARACPRPAEGCELDSALLSSLGVP